MMWLNWRGKRRYGESGDYGARMTAHFHKHKISFLCCWVLSVTVYRWCIDRGYIMCHLSVF